MPKFNPPECFQFDKPADWSEWKQRFLRFRTATKLDYQARGGYRRNLDEVSEEYVATDTDDTYFLGSIFCESPVNSCNDKSRGFDSGQFCSVDCYVSDETKWDMDHLVS